MRLLYAGGSHFYIAGSQLKSIKNLGGSWLKTKQMWKLPVNAGVVRDLTTLYPGVEIPGTLAKVLEGFGFPLRELPGHINLHKAYPYQSEAMQYLLSTPHKGSLLGLSPGLGKTMVSILASDMADDKRVLVVSPKSLMLNWLKEHNKWSTNDNAEITWNRPPPEGNGFCIISYETLVKYLDAYCAWRPDRVIFDESVMLKNRATRRFKAARQLRAYTPSMWLLSGSPVTRYPDDLFTQLHLCDPKRNGSYWKFAERYCLIERTPFGTKVAGASPHNNPREDFRDLMLVRNQKEVLPDLPELIFQTYEVTLTPKQRAAHIMIKGAFVAELESGVRIETPNVMAQLIRLQQVTSNLVNIDPEAGSCSAKEDLLFELLEAGEIPTPCVVWTHWRATGVSLHDRLAAAKYRVGLASGVSGNSDKVIQNFKEGGLDVLVLSLGVGKFGHTLTNAKAAAYFDKTWDADAFVQSMARLHRIGLEHRPLIVTLKATDTVDELVEDNLAGKMPVITKVSNADLANLLKGIGR